MPEDGFFQRPRISDRGISVVLTIGEPAENAQRVIQTLVEHFEKQGRSHEVILVAPPAGADADRRLKQLAAAEKRLRLVWAKDAPGRGEALKLGLATAKYPLVLTTDAGTILAGDQIDRLLEHIDRVDLVAGRRVGSQAGLGNHLVTRAKARLARTVFGACVRDPWSPVKLYRRAAIAPIPIQSLGDFAEVELVAKANFLGLLIDEVDISLGAPAARAATPPAAEGPPTAIAPRPCCHDAWTVFHQPQFRLPRESHRPQRDRRADRR